MLPIWMILLITLHQVTAAEIPNVDPEFLAKLREAGNDEAYAKFLKLDDVKLVRPQEERSDIETTNVSPLGDILLTPEQEEQARQGINLQKYPRYRWPNHVIPYAIEEKDFSLSQRNRIESAIRTLSDRMTNLKIRKRTDADKDYVMVFSGNGCYSYLGKIGGQQALSLQSNGCLRTGTIQHEFIHAAGFMHEHCRPDRDDYVNVLFENIPENWRSQYEKANANDFGIQGPYDYYSVMHYGMNAPGGKRAFEFYDNSVNTRRVGQRDGPTGTDIRKIDTLYG